MLRHIFADYRHHSFGLLVLLVLWFLVIRPELERTRVLSETQFKAAASLENASNALREAGATHATLQAQQIILVGRREATLNRMEPPPPKAKPKE